VISTRGSWFSGWSVKPLSLGSAYPSTDVHKHPDARAERLSATLGSFGRSMDADAGAEMTRRSARTARRTGRSAVDPAPRTGPQTTSVTGGGDPFLLRHRRATVRVGCSKRCPVGGQTSAAEGGDSLLPASLSTDGRSSGTEGAGWSSQCHPAPEELWADLAAAGMPALPPRWAENGHGPRSIAARVPLDGQHPVSRRGRAVHESGVSQLNVKGGRLTPKLVSLLQ
jgi:hypothetical protein